ncbi:MAG: DUF1287 domain-containing protein [Chitinivibrionales bacterium]|nr:DUF1287 domain-containing protein [Chitinivibrionales bacterium]
MPGDLDHIGIVVNVQVADANRYYLVHNIGNGAELEDVLFEFKIAGQYSFFSGL